MSASAARGRDDQPNQSVWFGWDPLAGAPIARLIHRASDHRAAIRICSRLGGDTSFAPKQNRPRFGTFRQENL
ncbi:hypothetical protein ACH4OW_26720 [Streptomyces sp. NPDC017056]|uniref:hypothetical protein n=1 Tax=Streptomyces sp. NPDC017056 TaxID=3364973 RepID=UPI0037B8A71F